MRGPQPPKQRGRRSCLRLNAACVVCKQIDRRSVCFCVVWACRCRGIYISAAWNPDFVYRRRIRNAVRLVSVGGFHHDRLNDLAPFNRQCGKHSAVEPCSDTARFPAAAVRVGIIHSPLNRKQMFHQEAAVGICAGFILECSEHSFVCTSSLHCDRFSRPVCDFFAIGLAKVVLPVFCPVDDAGSIGVRINIPVVRHLRTKHKRRVMNHRSRRCDRKCIDLGCGGRIARVRTVPIDLCVAFDVP